MNFAIGSLITRHMSAATCLLCLTLRHALRKMPNACAAGFFGRSPQDPPKRHRGHSSTDADNQRHDRSHQSLCNSSLFFGLPTYSQRKTSERVDGGSRTNFDVRNRLHIRCRSSRLARRRIFLHRQATKSLIFHHLPDKLALLIP